MELVDSWLRFLRAAGRSPATLDAYQADMRHLSTFVGTREPETITRRQIEEFLVAGLERGLSPAAIARCFRSLQQFFRWAAEESEIDVNPMARMKPPTVPLQPPEVLTDDEIKRLLEACRNKPNHGRSGEFERRRDTAMLLMLVTTGIRSGELLGLRVEDALMNVAGWRSSQMLNRYGASAAAERGRDAHRKLFGEDRL